jgi:hypothetical protein
MNINELHSFKISDAVQLHDRLNPALFHDDHMREDVRGKLLEIAHEFIDYLGVNDLNVRDITVSGSNAAYSYTQHSDIDLHVVVDMKRLPDDEIYQELFTAKKNLFNSDHHIKIKGYDVELYVQDSNKPVRTLGEYSVLNDEWNKFPSRRRANFDESAVKHKFDKLAHLASVALRSNDVDALGELLGTIKRYRQAGLDEHGEWGPENLAYKALRSQGIIDRLYDHVDHLRDRELSLDEELYEQFYRPLPQLTKSLKDTEIIEKLKAHNIPYKYNQKTRKFSIVADNNELYKAGIFEASGYIPSEAEKDDPRFEKALSVDVHPDTLEKQAKKWGWKTSRAGVPPTLKASGKI